MMGKFQMALDAIPMERIPVKTLANGVKMPGIGLGTFGSDKYGAEQIADIVYGAVQEKLDLSEKIQ